MGSLPHELEDDEITDGVDDDDLVAADTGAALLAIQKLPQGCPKWADTKVTSLMSKMRGGGLRPLLDKVEKKDAFFVWLPLDNLVFLVNMGYFGCSVAIVGRHTS